MRKIISAVSLYVIAIFLVGCSVDTVDKIVGAKGQKFVYRINATKCTACGNCVSKCPEKAIAEYQVDKITWAYVIDPEKCTGCGICVDYCEDDAIEASYFKE